MASDNDDVKNDDNDDDDDDNDDDDANSKDVKVVEMATGQTLTMLDRLVNLKYLSKKERNQIKEDKSAEQKARPYQWLFYVRIKFVW